MNLSAVRLPRLIPPPVRPRAEENRAELARLETLVAHLAGALAQVSAGSAREENDPWIGIRSAFVAVGSGVETLGDVESALAADEGRWLSQLATESPEAGDADAIEFCLDRIDKIRARLSVRKGKELQAA